MRFAASTGAKPNTAAAACASLRKSTKTSEFKIQNTALHVDKQELPPKNYCDDDLDTLYNPKDWYDDTWWRF